MEIVAPEHVTPAYLHAMAAGRRVTLSTMQVPTFAAGDLPIDGVQVGSFFVHPDVVLDELVWKVTHRRTGRRLCTFPVNTGRGYTVPNVAIGLALWLDAYFTPRAWELGGVSVPVDMARRARVALRNAGCTFVSNEAGLKT